VDVAVVSTAAAVLATLPALAWKQLTGEDGEWVAIGTAVAAAVLPWLYFSVAWWLGGRTVGALMMGLIVTRPDGGRLGAVRAGLRAAVGLMFAPVWLVGLLMIIWDGRRRALHDRVFGTVVRYRAGDGRGRPDDDRRTGSAGYVSV
jgi:uncharacterized RDD family membrane protein YckC